MAPPADLIASAYAGPSAAETAARYRIPPPRPDFDDVRSRPGKWHATSDLSSEQLSEIVRKLHPKDTLKWLARVLDVPFGTAKHWLYVKFSSARRRELAAALLAEMDREDIERSAIRRTLARWAMEGDCEMGAGMAGILDAEGLATVAQEAPRQRQKNLP